VVNILRDNLRHCCSGWHCVHSAIDSVSWKVKMEEAMNEQALTSAQQESMGRHMHACTLCLTPFWCAKPSCEAKIVNRCAACLGEVPSLNEAMDVKLAQNIEFNEFWN
jgi:hypothetical protein